MKCRICASECPPGAKLCRDCAAARKRAFAATVTQPLLAAAGAPSVRQVRFAPRPSKPRRSGNPGATSTARSEAAMAASAAGGIVPRTQVGARWLWISVAIAVTVVYLLIRFAANHGQPTGDAAAPGDSASEVAAPVDAGNAVPQRAAEPIQPPAARVAASRPGDFAPEDAKEDAGLVSKNPKAVRRKAVSKVEPPPAASAEPPPAPKAEPVAALRPPPAVEAPKDPWQAMNEGLSRCAREDWIHRSPCEQGLRLKYCPNYWGLVWQCPVGPPTDHGQ